MRVNIIETFQPRICSTPLTKAIYSPESLPAAESGDLPMAISVRDVAREAGVSVGTVSNVLNRPAMVAPATVERVTAVIQKLGFVRNEAARQLREGRSRSFGLVVLDARNPFFMDVNHGAQSRALENGYSVLMGTSDESSDHEHRLLDLFEEQRVAGILISPVDADLTRLWRIREAGTPVVLVDRGSSDKSFSSVSVDDVEGGRLAVQHLLDLGRRRIVFVGGPENIVQVKERFAGAQAAVSATPSASLELRRTSSLSVLAGRQVGEEIASSPEDERPDAIFAANDLLATGLLQALVMNGSVKVPQDIALIGYDDIDFMQSAVIPISSIKQPAAEIGKTAVELLLREAEANPDSAREQILFTPELVARESTIGRLPIESASDQSP